MGGPWRRLSRNCHLRQIKSKSSAGAADQRTPSSEHHIHASGRGFDPQRQGLHCFSCIPWESNPRPSRRERQECFTAVRRVASLWRFMCDYGMNLDRSECVNVWQKRLVADRCGVYWSAGFGSDVTHVLELWNRSTMQYSCCSTRGLQHRCCRHIFSPWTSSSTLTTFIHVVFAILIVMQSRCWESRFIAIKIVFPPVLIHN